MKIDSRKLLWSAENRLIYLTLAAFSLEAIIRYVVIIIKKLPLISAFSGLFTPALFIFLIYLNYRQNIKKKILTADVLFALMFYLIVAVSYLAYPNTRQYVERDWNTILVVFPAYYFLGIIFKAEKSMMDMLAFLAKIIIIVDILFVVYYTGVGNELGEDAMARAYRILPSVLFLTMQAFNRKKIVDWAWMVFATIYIFTCGTRGPIIVVVAYLAYCLLLKQKSTIRGKMLSIATLAALLVFYYSKYFNKFLIVISDFFKQLGLSTRVIDHMLEDTLVSDSSGRDLIYEKIYELLAENPLGYGIMGEFQFLNWNTHNFYLQLLMHFGIIFGAIIIIAILVIIGKAYSKNPNQYAKDFIIMWACVTLIRGFAGGSYLSYYFAFLLGLCINQLRNKI